MQLENQLKSIGLNKSDIKVYLCLLKADCPIHPRNVSRETFISRTNCYNILKNLVSIGLADEVESGGKKLFAGRPPETMLEVIDRKRSSIEKLIPILRTGISEDENDELRRVEGIDSVTQLLTDALQHDRATFYGSVHTYAKMFEGAFRAAGDVQIIDSGHWSSVAFVSWNQTIALVDVWSQPFAVVINKPEIQEFIVDLLKSRVTQQSRE